MPDYRAESLYLAQGPGPVCGVDEAGRGPLAGPVVAAAVIFLDRQRIPRGLDDSKKLSALAREQLHAQILQNAVVGIGEASVDEIDLLNIRRATHLAMARAVAALSVTPAYALVDGNDAPPLLCPCQTIIGGDGLSLSIAAASIIAKVTRDHLMLRLHQDHPGYGWDSNMGYSTRTHLVALNRLGPTPHHRRSFAPVRLAYQMLGSHPMPDSID
ncbi:MAG: ribonuclease HII [Alphaproteobacteria bacterium]|nr:ribonuclease HII [Alphaproteobacteria bacterium]